MKILIVPSWYTTKKNPNAGSFFKEQAEALSQNGNEVSVLSIEQTNIRECIFNKSFLLKSLNINGVRTFQVFLPGFGLKKIGLDLWLKELYYRFYLKKVIKIIGQPNIIHAHSSLYAGYIMCKIKGKIPVVVTEHYSLIQKGQLDKTQNKCLCYTVENSDKFICVSNSLANSVKQLTNTTKNIEVIPNMVDDKFHFEIKQNSNSFIFLCVCNLIKLKRVDLLIQAFYQAFADNNSVFLNVVGDGIEKENLSNIIRKYNMDNRILLKGAIGRENIFEMYHNSDAFVMVSESETFGVVYVEALACGLPTIGVNNGGAEDILKGYGGYICKKNDVEDIASTMKIVYNNRNNHNKELISKKAIELYGKKNIVPMWENSYVKVLKN